MDRIEIMFYTKVNKSSRKEMVNFLENHFRYWTMNSWNGLSSYANNVKIYNLNLTSEQKNKFYEFMEYNLLKIFFDDIEALFINDFQEKTGYTAYFNGRMDGYIVLVACEKKYFNYKSICTYCGQYNYNSIEETGNCKCGRCGEDGRKNLQKPIYQSKISVRGIDANENFNDKEEWPLYRLKDRVELVQAFDMLCDDIRDYLIEFLDSHEIMKEEYTSTRTVLKTI